MNLKVTFTYIATEDDWSVSELLQNCGTGFNSDEAKDILKNAFLEDAQYIIENSQIALVKEDTTSL
jgi:hypothetical protein